MPDAYEVHDAQFLQQGSNSSAADALIISVGPVPAGKVWTILRAYGSVSVSETQYFWFAIRSGSRYYPVNLPTQFLLNPTVSKFFPMLREGMEQKLFPSETLNFMRDAATAGSTLYIYTSFIETDLQYYVELDKHKVLQRRQMAMEASSPMRRTGLIGPSSRSAPLSPPTRPRFER